MEYMYLAKVKEINDNGKNFTKIKRRATMLNALFAPHTHKLSYILAFVIDYECKDR